MDDDFDELERRASSESDDPIGSAVLRGFHELLADETGDGGGKDPQARYRRARALLALRTAGTTVADEECERAVWVVCTELSRRRDVASQHELLVLAGPTVQSAGTTPAALRIRFLAAWACSRLGDQVDALRQFEELHADEVRVLGGGDVEEISTRSEMASLRAELGQIEAGIGELEQVLFDQERLLGPLHPGTLVTRHNLANWRREAGQPAFAAALFERLLTDEARLWGADDPSPRTTRHNLALSYHMAGRHDDALEMWRANLVDRG